MNENENWLQKILGFLAGAKPLQQAAQQGQVPQQPVPAQNTNTLQSAVDQYMKEKAIKEAAAQILAPKKVQKVTPPVTPQDILAASPRK